MVKLAQGSQSLFPRSAALSTKSRRFLTQRAQSASALRSERELRPEGRPGREGEGRIEQRRVTLFPHAVGSLQHSRGAAGLSALTYLGPRGGWCGLGTRTQRPPADRGSTPGPARPARGLRANSSADTCRRRSPWFLFARRPVPGHRARSLRRGGRITVGEGPAGEGRLETGRAESRCGRAAGKGRAEWAE